MKTKAFIFSTIIFLQAIFLISCNNDDDQQQEIKLSEVSISLYIQTECEIVITGGSGKYSARIDTPIAEVEIKKQESENVLLIQSLSLGEATITVKDEMTAKEATCLVKIIEERGKNLFVDIQYGVDADQKEIIIKDMEDTNPFPEGSFVTSKTLTNTTQQWIIHAPDNSVLADGILTTNIEKNYPSLYNLVRINDQIYAQMRYDYNRDNEEVTYDCYVVDGKHTRMNIELPKHIRMYENMTEYYKTKYPDAGVKGAIRVYFIQYELND